MRHLLLAVLLLGCGPQRQPIVLQESTDPRVLTYVAHWDQVRHVKVYCVPGLVTPYRILATSTAYLREDLGGLEWEIPLAAQDVLDPKSWTWSLWGPLYPGQPQRFIDVTNH